MELFEALHTRRSVGKVGDPGPDTDAIRSMLAAGMAAPDHGGHRPWRFVVLRDEARVRLGEAFAAALLTRRPDADAAAVAADQSKPLRAPVLIAVICAPVLSVKAPEWEQLASTAAAAQNILLAAHGLGFGAMWRTGWFVDAPEVHSELGLKGAERLVGLLYVGTPTAPPLPRADVDLEAVTIWRTS